MRQVGIGFGKNKNIQSSFHKIITLLKSIQNSQHFQMKIKELPLKNDTSFDFSSRQSLDIGSARSMYKVGERAKYMQRKQMPDDNSIDPSSQSQVSMHISEKLIHLNVQNISRHQSPLQTKLSLSNYIAQQVPKLSHQQIIPIQLKHISINALECVIYLCFLLGSLSAPAVFKYIDMGGNILCLMKIITIHVLIICLNSKKQLQESSNKQPKTVYINKLFPYELLQIWSLITICLLYIFSNPVIHALISSLRLIRLFFPFFIDRTEKWKWRAKVFGHILKVVFFIFVATIIISISIQLLLYNLDGYFCLVPSQFYQEPADHLASKLQSCGLFSPCTENLQCRNIYLLAQNDEQKLAIQTLINSSSPSFSKSLLYSMDVILSAGGTLYSTYQTYIMNWFWFPLIIAIYLLYVILTGIGIGESIRYESLEDWKRNQQKFHEEQLRKSIQKSQLQLKNKKKHRVSNISFSSPQPIQVSTIISPDQYSTEFTAQIVRIQSELQGRNLKQKFATVFFNTLCVLHILLVIGDNLNFSPLVNRCIGIGLAIIFIFWTFGLGLGLYNFFTEEQSQKSTIKSRIMLYQTITYLFMLADYALRLILGKYLLEDSTQVTPFAYALISLRIVFVLYNNGFDPYISYYMQKMMQNFVNNLPILILLLTTGISIGLLLSYINSVYLLSNQIDFISKGIGVIYGTGSFGMQNSLRDNLISIFLKFVGILANFYIAKHINMGYDAILEIDFKQWPLHMPNTSSVNKTQSKVKNNKDANNLIDAITMLHQSIYYHYARAIIVFVYMTLTLLFQCKKENVNIAIFVFDIYLLLDIVTKVMSCGIKGPASYFSTDPFIKFIYIVSQIFCFISLFISSIPLAVKVAFHISRSFIIFACFSELYQIYQLIKSIIFHPKIRIYKILILSFALLFVGLVLVSFYPGQSNLSNSDKILNSLAFAISYAYNLGWSFTSNSNVHNTLPLSMNMIFISLILFLHVILTFMMVTYFVNRKVRCIGPPSQEILRQYQSNQPQFYYHQLVISQSIYKYLKVVKIIIILISLVFLGLLSGNLLQFSTTRRYQVATANIVMFLIETSIYLIESIYIKIGNGRWSIVEAILLILSAPGTFLIIFPVLKFSTYFKLSIVIHVCLFFSILRLLRILPILTNHSISLLSSKFLRRIRNQLYLHETLGIFLFNVMALLPFSTFHALLFSADISTEFLNFLTGSIFEGNSIGVGELIYKFICTFLVLFPLRTLLLARVISSFLSNKPNQLMVLKDEIEEKICQSKILDKDLSTLFLPYHDIYRFSAQIYKVYEQFSSGKRVNCLKYDEMMTKISQLDIPIYEYNNFYPSQSIYGVLLCDLIWNIFVHLFHHQEQQFTNIDSLLQKIVPQPQNIVKSHMGTRKLCAYLKMQQKMKKILLRAKNNLKIKTSRHSLNTTK